MQVSAPDRDQLRHLAELRLDRPVVLSLYLNLDPSEFATPPARKTSVRSLLDEAERRLRDRNGLSHEDRMGLQASLERASKLPGERAPDGRRARRGGVQQRARGPVRGAEAASQRAEPGGHRAFAARGAARTARAARALVRGARQPPRRPHPSRLAESLREIEQIHDEVFGQHDQGGWSQSRYQRGIEKEKDDHLKHTGDALMRHFKQQPFQRLIVGGPREVAADFESKLHHYLQERLAGRIEVDGSARTPTRCWRRPAR